MKRPALVILLCSALVGCYSFQVQLGSLLGGTVLVTSEPPGASVYISEQGHGPHGDAICPYCGGRYGWLPFRQVGTTPCKILYPSNWTKVRVVWPDGTESEVRGGYESPDGMGFLKPGSPPPKASTFGGKPDKRGADK